ncbi:hypothetical protein AGDE_17049 [Angomonas deanei]|uniref:Leucine Rich repeat n=1 Tax=Angomonas deanei TaxID=59799 RepID=A0A7G2CQU9_9TRYP|nr:hypothetical protein AGDE_17049 [Angomonas deanei]CAD2221371.1 hypothetical protein, conserved [Angomonas deanei]|eukprot:EPY15612.1 hypothetical protein AGDE_17049 [Angomonas deanei]
MCTLNMSCLSSPHLVVFVFLYCCISLIMFPFQNMSDYMDYFGESSPLALVGANSHARVSGERHTGGVLGWEITTGDYGTRRESNENSFVSEKFRRSMWWLMRQSDYPLGFFFRLGGERVLDDIIVLEQFSKKLSIHNVEHSFHLDIKGCQSLLPFSVLLPRTESICLTDSWLTSLQSLESLEVLRSVEMTDCHGDFNLAPLGSCKNLTHLDVAYCKGSTGLKALGSLRSLKVVDVRGLNITTVEFLKNCDNLETLYVSDCEHLNSLDGLSGLESLTYVMAKESGVKNIRGLSGCVALQTLDVSNCKHLSSLNGLSGLRNLTYVTAEESGVKSIRGLSVAWPWRWLM